MSIIGRPTFKILTKCIRLPYFALSHQYLHKSSFLYGEGIPLKMPSLSPTMEEGKIVKWLKQEGDSIQPGDVLCDIETDKAVVSFEIDEEGVLAKILVGQDSGTIKIGTLIALMAAEGEDWKTVTIPPGITDVASVPAATNATTAATTTATTAAANVGGDNRKYGPSVRLLLEQYGLPSNGVAGTGPHGELLKGDVLQHVVINAVQKVPLKAVAPPIGGVAPSLAPKAKVAAIGPPSLSPYTDVEVSNMRRTIAKRLSQSKSGIAHSYGTLECRVDALLALRRQFKEDGVSVSVNDLLVKAVAAALAAVPAVNCVWQGNTVVPSANVDVSIAVATPAGLITPIIKGADSLGVKAISDVVRELATKAKQNKLQPEEFMGGTFTISNLGMFGITEFSAIINPPQCGILAVGGSRMVLGSDGEPETRLRATLSYDRLAIDDDSAQLFLSTLTQLIEDPAQLILGRLAHGADHPLRALL